MGKESERDRATEKIRKKIRRKQGVLDSALPKQGFGIERERRGRGGPGKPRPSRIKRQWEK